MEYKCDACFGTTTGIVPPKTQKVHEIKIQQEFVVPILDGRKTFEIRLNDRGYKLDDYVRFKPVDEEGNPLINYPAAETIKRKLYKITYSISNFGMKDGYIVFGIREIETPKTVNRIHEYSTVDLVCELARKKEVKLVVENGVIDIKIKASECEWNT